MKTSITITTDSNTTPLLIVAVLLAAIVPACGASEEEEETSVVPAEVATIEIGTIIRRFGYRECSRPQEGSTRYEPTGTG
jgi:hypothetical protein